MKESVRIRIDLTVYNVALRSEKFTVKCLLVHKIARASAQLGENLINTNQSSKDYLTRNVMESVIAYTTNTDDPN